MNRAVILLFLVSIFACPAVAGTKVLRSESMRFDACLALIRETSSKLGVAPINIVETNILRMVRFKTNDGSGESLLVTCSKLDQKLIINLSW